MQFTVPKGIDYTQLSAFIGVDERELRQMNPESGELVGGQTINVPYSSPFEDYYRTTPSADPAQDLFDDFRDYVYPPLQEAGETVRSVATKVADQLVTQEPSAREMFLDYMGDVEGRKIHMGAEGGPDALTYGYGLKESTRAQLDIPKSRDNRAMAAMAYDSFYQKARESIQGLDEMDKGAQTFATSAVWNTGQVWDSVKHLAETDEFDTQKVGRWLNNMRTGGKYLPGLGNRRAKDYNLLAKSRGWPKVAHVKYTPDGATFTFENGAQHKFNQKLEPTKQPEVIFR